MQKTRARLALFVAVVLAAMTIGALTGAAAGPRARANKEAGDVLQAAGYLLGPRPQFFELRVADMPPGEKIHINAKIHCDNVAPGDHLHIHSGPSQFKASDPMAASCDGEGDSGFAQGSTMGMCNGQPATATYDLQDNPPEGPSLLGGKKKDEDTADITVTGAPGCNMDASGPFQGNIEFKDNTPSPSPSTSSVSAPPNS